MEIVAPCHEAQDGRLKRLHGMGLVACVERGVPLEKLLFGEVVLSRSDLDVGHLTCWTSQSEAWLGSGLRGLGLAPAPPGYLEKEETRATGKL